MWEQVKFWFADFVVILIACMVAEYAMDRLKAWRERDLDINCDNCQKPVPLARTPDKKHYLCETCMPAYLTEHFPEMDPTAFKRAFRRRKMKKRRAK